MPYLSHVLYLIEILSVSKPLIFQLSGSVFEKKFGLQVLILTARLFLFFVEILSYPVIYLFSKRLCCVLGVSIVLSLRT